MSLFFTEVVAGVEDDQDNSHRSSWLPPAKLPHAKGKDSGMGSAMHLTSFYWLLSFICRVRVQSCTSSELSDTVRYSLIVGAMRIGRCGPTTVMLLCRLHVIAARCTCTSPLLQLQLESLAAERPAAARWGSTWQISRAPVCLLEITRPHLNEYLSINKSPLPLEQNLAAWYRAISYEATPKRNTTLLSSNQGRLFRRLRRQDLSQGPPRSTEYCSWSQASIRIVPRGPFSLVVPLYHKLSTSPSSLPVPFSQTLATS